MLKLLVRLHKLFWLILADVKLPEMEEEASNVVNAFASLGEKYKENSYGMYTSMMMTSAVHIFSYTLSFFPGKIFSFYADDARFFNNNRSELWKTLSQVFLVPLQKSTELDDWAVRRIFRIS